MSADIAERIEIAWGHTRHHSNRSRAEVIEALTADRPGEWTVTDWKDCETHLWILREIEANGQPHRLITCTCIESYPRHITWKTLYEEGGFFYTDCPRRFLDLAPVPDSPYARGWRQRVRSNRKK